MNPFQSDREEARRLRNESPEPRRACRHDRSVRASTPDAEGKVTLHCNDCGEEMTK